MAGTLEARHLDVGYYRDLNILLDLSLVARARRITTILGANGVGKSTGAEGDLRLPEAVLG